MTDNEGPLIPTDSEQDDGFLERQIRPRLTVRIIVFLLMVVTLATIYFLGNRYFDLQRLVALETQLRTTIANAPLRSTLVCFGIYVMVSFVPGTTGKSLVVAWLFGFWWALLIVNIALTTAATGSFLASRYLLQEFVQFRFGRFIARGNEAISGEGGWYVLLLRIIHAPFTVVNYFFGATSIKPQTFWWATQIGLLPGNIVFVYAGSQLPSLDELAKRGFGSLLSPSLIAAFVLLTILPLIVHRLALKNFRRTSIFNQVLSTDDREPPT